MSDDLRRCQGCDRLYNVTVNHTCPFCTAVDRATPDQSPLGE